jgi:hypothetical protein
MIYVYNQFEDLKAVFSNEDNDASPYLYAKMTEELNGALTFEFEVPADNHSAQWVDERAMILAKDREGDNQFFYVIEVEETHGDGGEHIKRAYCEHAIVELKDEIVESLDLTSSSMNAVDTLLTGTRWKRGQHKFNKFSQDERLRFVYKNKLEILNTVIEVFGLEVKYRIEVEDGHIKNRYIDFFDERGTFTGQRFEYNKNLINITRTVDNSEIKTALIGLGKTLTPRETISFEETSGPLHGYIFAAINGGSADNHWLASIETEIRPFVKTLGTELLAAGLYQDQDFPIAEFVKYTNFVLEDGDELNDWLTHLPTYARPAVQRFGEKLLPYQGVNEEDKLFQFKEGGAFWNYIQTIINTQDADNVWLSRTPLDMQVYIHTLGIILLENKGVASDPSFDLGALLNYTNAVIKYGDPNNDWLTAQPLKYQETILAFGQDMLQFYGIEATANQPEKRLTFESVNNGKNYVEDLVALAAHGRRENGGGMRHRWGIYINEDIEDPVQLFEATKRELEGLRSPRVTYEATVANLAEIEGFPYEQVHLGTASILIDDDLNIEMRARVIKQVYDLVNDNLTEITLGEFATTQSRVFNKIREAEERLRVIQVSNLDLGGKVATVKETAEEAKEKASTAEYTANQAKGTAEAAEQTANDTALALDDKADKGTVSLLDQSVSNLKIDIGDISDSLDQAFIDIGQKASTADLSALNTQVGTIKDNLDAAVIDIGEKASQLDLNEANRIISDIKIQVDDQGVAIGRKVETTEFDKVTGRLETVETTTEDHATMFLDTITKTEFSTVTGRLSTVETTVGQHADKIENMVTRTEYDPLAGTVSTLETTVGQHADKLLNVVTSTEFSTVTGELSSLESRVEQTESSISQKVSKTDYNGNTIASLINQTATTIRIKAENIDLEGSVTASDLDITTDLKVGNKISLGDPYDNSTKELQFSASAYVRGDQDAHGGAPKLYLGAQAIELQGDTYIDYRFYGKSWYSTYHDDYIINDHLNGNITMSAAGGSLYVGYKNTSVVRVNAPIIFQNRSIETSEGETGMCGIGAHANGLSSTACMVGVNFRNRKTYDPSSVTFDTLVGNKSPRYNNLSRDGFLLYLYGEGTNGLVYWRGYFNA